MEINYYLFFFREFGNSKYKNYLPLLIISTRMNLLHIFQSIKSVSKNTLKKEKDFIMIWLTGLCSKDLSIYYSLTAWSKFNNIPQTCVTQSGKLLSLRHDQDFKNIYKSGQMMFLSNEQCNTLTQNDLNMIELQLIVH